jgi:hypothetical protein
MEPIVYLAIAFVGGLFVVSSLSTLWKGKVK